MHILAAVFPILTVSFAILYELSDSAVAYSLAVTFFTFAYHFIMRLCVGKLSSFLPEPNLNVKWYVLKSFEKKLYKRLNVKKWKDYIPTYYPDAFLLDKNAPEDILKTMCNAERVHEIIMILSFVPVLFSICFGEFLVFFITSIIASLVDSVFVIVQRYNRPRILKLIRHKNKQLQE